MSEPKADPPRCEGGAAAELEDSIERLRRELGAQRMKQARDQGHQAVAAMGLVYTALAGLVDAEAEVAESMRALDKVRKVRDSVARLQQKLEGNGGPTVSRGTAESELRYRPQQG